MYEDIAGEVVRENHEYQRLKQEYIVQDKMFCQKLLKIDENLNQEVEQLIHLFFELAKITYIELYLKGAEDRERMLR